MTGSNDAITESGVAAPRISCDRTTLNRGSSVLTVCVSEIATAAKDRLAATWPNACMLAGPRIFFNSSLVMGRWKEASLAPRRYVTPQYNVPTTTWIVDTNHGNGKMLKRDLLVRLKPTFKEYHSAMKPRVTTDGAFLSPTNFAAVLHRNAQCWVADAGIYT